MIRSSTRGASRRLLAPALLAGFVVASCGGPAPTATPVASSPPSSGAASAAPVSPAAAVRGRDGTS